MLLVVFIISLISFVGIFTLSMRQEQIRRILFYIVSFAAGSLLGAAFLDLLPEALETGGRESVFALLLIGILTSFVIEKFLFHYHCHHHGKQHKDHYHIKPVGFLNLIGDGVHNFIDGIVVAGSFFAGPHVGISTSIAIIAHEIPQEISDFGVLLHAGFTRARALLFNFLTACMAIVGAIIGFIFSTTIESFTTYLVAFAAGNFVYIAASDLIPELHHETDMRKSFLQFVMLVIGILVILAIKIYVPEQ
ncbi:ZIP family metal transporter [Candidatus Woesearchaeota archaeon]|nr:ZIP family metal transporter [Candidatus Woesearchaeota archaeon]